MKDTEQGIKSGDSGSGKGQGTASIGMGMKCSTNFFKPTGSIVDDQTSS